MLFAPPKLFELLGSSFGLPWLFNTAFLPDVVEDRGVCGPELAVLCPIAGGSWFCPILSSVVVLPELETGVELTNGKVATVPGSAETILLGSDMVVFGSSAATGLSARGGSKAPYA